jgi:hypothetical protein
VVRPLSHPHDIDCEDVTENILKNKKFKFVF